MHELQVHEVGLQICHRIRKLCEGWLKRFERRRGRVGPCSALWWFAKGWAGWGAEWRGGARGWIAAAGRRIGAPSRWGRGLRGCGCHFWVCGKETLALWVRNGVLPVECVHLTNYWSVGGGRQAINAFALALQLENSIPKLYGETVASGAFKRGWGSRKVFIRRWNVVCIMRDWTNNTNSWQKHNDAVQPTTPPNPRSDVVCWAARLKIPSYTNKKLPIMYCQRCFYLP